MLRGIYGDPERYKETYWSRFPGMYFAGDGAKRDADGYFWLLGRVDDVMNVSGHRLSTTEIESALVSHPAVAEAAVVGGPDPVTGEAINAFVILRLGNEPTPELGEELRAARRDEDQPDREAEDADVRRRTCRRPARARSCVGCSRDIAQGRDARRHDDPRRRERRRDDPRRTAARPRTDACHSTSCDGRRPTRARAPSPAPSTSRRSRERRHRRSTA